MRSWHISNKGFILVRTLLFLMFILQYLHARSMIALHIASENTIDIEMENFSFFEAAVLDKIAKDIAMMNYSDFELRYDDSIVKVRYHNQTAQLDFSGSVETSMLLGFDDLVPCFTSYETQSR